MDIANLSLAAKAGIGLAALSTVAIGATVFGSNDPSGPLMEIVECDSPEHRYATKNLMSQYYAERSEYHVDDIDVEIIDEMEFLGGEENWKRCQTTVTVSMPNGVHKTHKMRYAQRHRNADPSKRTVFSLSVVY